MKDVMKVWAPALTLLFAVAFLPACQKELLDSTDTALASTTFGAEDRGGGGDSTGGPRRHRHHGHPPHDSLGHPPHDSLHPHPHDSLHPHPFDSIRPPHGGGGHHPHDSIPGGGCKTPPVSITVTDLPQAAQDWLKTNYPDATIQSVKKVTQRDCTVIYVVKIKDQQRPVRFDADGKKI